MVQPQEAAICEKDIDVWMDMGMVLDPTGAAPTIVARKKERFRGKGMVDGRDWKRELGRIWMGEDEGHRPRE